MGRKPNENIKKAEQLYRKGMKLIEIAESLGVPDSTVRRWKSTHKWDEHLKKTNRTLGKNNNERSGKPIKNKALLGNGNALGHKGRNKAGNQNAKTHGAYSKAYMCGLDEETINIISNMDVDEEQLLIAQIKQYTAREIYLSNQLEYYQNKTDNNGLFLENENTQVVEENFTGSIIRKGTSKTIQRTKGDILDAIIKLNSELSKVQANKIKAVASLARIRKDKAEIQNIIHGGIDTTAEPIMIYLPDNGREG